MSDTCYILYHYIYIFQTPAIFYNSIYSINPDTYPAYIRATVVCLDGDGAPGLHLEELWNVVNDGEEDDGAEVEEAIQALEVDRYNVQHIQTIWKCKRSLA